MPALEAQVHSSTNNSKVTEEAHKIEGLAKEAYGGTKNGWSSARKMQDEVSSISKDPELTKAVFKQVDKDWQNMQENLSNYNDDSVSKDVYVRDRLGNANAQLQYDKSGELTGINFHNNLIAAANEEVPRNHQRVASVDLKVDGQNQSMDYFK